MSAFLLCAVLFGSSGSKSTPKQRLRPNIVKEAPLKVIPVPVEAADLSVAEFSSRYANQLPVVLQLGKGQEAMNWSFETLSDRCANAYTPVFKRARSSQWAKLKPEGLANPSQRCRSTLISTSSARPGSFQ